MQGYNDVNYIDEAGTTPPLDSLEMRLERKIKTLNELLWEGRVTSADLACWLDNFCGASGVDGGPDCERLHALYILSHVVYFGSREIRELLRSVYRDLVRYPIIESIRRQNGDTTDVRFIRDNYSAQLLKMRFIGVGSPADSGTHLMYYFRQENSLPRRLFVNPHELVIMNTETHLPILKWPDVRRYVLIDDFIGTGKQVVEYSKGIISQLRACDPSIEVVCYALAATSRGLGRVRRSGLFNDVQCIYTLDDSFRCFDSSSRIFINAPSGISLAVARAICKRYGRRLSRNLPLGFGGMQLLLGFCHNTPNTTLPILWSRAAIRGQCWYPLFPRYPKAVEIGGGVDGK